MKGRNAVVIGGSGGIGAQVVRDLVAAGHKVFITYNRRRKQAEALWEELDSSRVRGIAQLDVSDYGAVEEVLNSARDVLGSVDILINTAGYLHQLAFLVDDKPEEIERTIKIELLGVIYPIKVVLPWMIEQGYGRIVTVGSDSGKVGSSAEAASAAARGGIIAFSKTVARETARYDICVNVVCPGPFDTELFNTMIETEGVTGKLMAAMVRAIPKRRPGRVEEISPLVVFLASDQASYITGQAVSVSGGLTMC